MPVEQEPKQTEHTAVNRPFEQRMARIIGYGVGLAGGVIEVANPLAARSRSGRVWSDKAMTREGPHISASSVQTGTPNLDEVYRTLNDNNLVPSLTRVYSTGPNGEVTSISYYDVSKGQNVVIPVQSDAEVAEADALKHAQLEMVRRLLGG